ncbi:MAG: hypothetical protein GPJ16_24095 [Microcystis aeruginosa G11-04]|uniref:Uncharacterized protein n=1 Tax=Microcystis aeruginosa G11-04 TaxID=2685956 RepID=A0A966G3V6_MICAE|nr:hypothetical protein [Microcystis aeruginosa G11-04]
MYPITDIYFEYVKTDIDLTSSRKGAKSRKGFSPVMVRQKWAIEQLSQLEHLTFVTPKSGFMSSYFESLARNQF